MEKKNSNTIIIAALSLLLLIAIGYIGYSKYTQAQEAKQLTIFQQGAQYGSQQAIVQIMQMASTCNQVPLYAGNVTMNLISVECLQQAAAAQNK